MPSRFETAEATEFAKFLNEFGDSVIRRIGGREDRTEPISAISSFDEKDMAKVGIDFGGQTTGDKGQFLEERGLLDVAADQETTPNDTYVIEGKVYRALGEQIGKDGGSKTIVLSRRTTQIAREPRLNRR